MTVEINPGTWSQCRPASAATHVPKPRVTWGEGNGTHKATTKHKTRHAHGRIAGGHGPKEFYWTGTKQTCRTSPRLVKKGR